jgi:hypothetical protein
MIVILAPKHHDFYAATVDGQPIVESSRTAFLDAARVLLARGVDPAEPLIMRHAGSDTDCLISTVGKAAALTVAEADRAKPKFIRWRPNARFPSAQGSENP